ncbi:DsbA family protein [Methylomonas sp. HW2-6]|uniref:DsbA family protein n=1 Tax=Methylomonas sp. HW2-6 TaxID=3376687 RepID=UPI0040430D91
MLNKYMEILAGLSAKNIKAITMLFFLSWVSSVSAEEGWVADEVFTQLSEMRKEIGQLKDKVFALEQKLVQSQPKAEPISLAGAANISSAKASPNIAVVEFSDYECPFCAKHNKNVLPKLRERYIDKGVIQYVMMDFPLEFHAHAKMAALATRCAGEQKQYWPMHDAIFEAKGQVNDELLAEVVSRHKLDLAVLRKCMDDPVQLDKLQSDIALGSSLGVNGTPAFLIGKINKNKQLVEYRRFDGVQSFETFASMIDSLKK